MLRCVKMFTPSISKRMHLSFFGNYLVLTFPHDIFKITRISCSNHVSYRAESCHYFCDLSLLFYAVLLICFWFFFRHQLNHFVSTLQQYVQSQLSLVSWCRFMHSLKDKVRNTLYLGFNDFSLHLLFGLIICLSLFLILWSTASWYPMVCLMIMLLF